MLLLIITAGAAAGIALLMYAVRTKQQDAANIEKLKQHMRRLQEREKARLRSMVVRPYQTARIE